MLTLKNFTKQINDTIIQRGKKYYENGHVLSIEEEDDGVWVAEVEGSEMYEVEITLKANGGIEDTFCDCPYDGGICKHVVAALFALQAETGKPGREAGKKTKKDVFETLLKSVTQADYQKFIRQYASGNKKFKTEFELFFADKDGRIDVEKKYAELLRKLVQKNSDHGFVDYRSSFSLSNDISKLLANGSAYLAKDNFRDALALVKGILKPVMEIQECCDDSNGDLGDNVMEALKILENIISAKAVPINIKEEAFYFLQKELGNKLYFDYGDFGYEMFALFQQLAVQLEKSVDFLAFIDAQTATLKGGYEGYRKEFFQKSKIEFLQQTGKTAEAEVLVQQNLDIVEVRMAVVNKAIAKKDFTTAKKLIADGIKLAVTQSHPGTVNQWKKELLRIAVLEKDIPAIRNYTKGFAFDGWFSTDYYRQWKATFAPDEWRQAIEAHIAETIQKVTAGWESKKSNMWRPAPHPPLLEALGPVFIEEKYWDRLLKLVQQENSLNTTLHYHPHLVKNHAAELLALYLPALEKFGMQTADRSGYASLVNTMKKIIKDIPQGKAQILAVAQRLKQTFSSKPRRPAMIDELNKLLGK